METSKLAAAMAATITFVFLIKFQKS